MPLLPVLHREPMEEWIFTAASATVRKVVLPLMTLSRLMAEQYFCDGFELDKYALSLCKRDV